MRKLLPLFLVGILVLSGLGVVSVANDKINDFKTKTESIFISEPIIKDAGQYVTINLEGAESSLLEVGKPMLPIVTKVFTFPFGTIISNVYVSFSDAKELVLSKEVQPASEYFPAEARVASEPVKDAVAYRSTALYPASSYGYTIGAGLDGKEHVIYLAVQCYPVRYSPVKNMIYYSENAKIQVVYKEPVTPTLFPYKYDLVIISPSEFSNALQPLINHKNSYNVSTILKTTNDIYSQYSGYDNAEKIKYFIKDAIENWGIKYVLLVGSIDKLPIRSTWFFLSHHGEYWNQTIISDLYYADIYDSTGGFSSWDSNGNGMYGEIYMNCPGVNDTLDLYPDVNIGRLACVDANEVSIVVDKIINYETSTYGKSWFNNIILCGGDTFPGYDGCEGEEENKIVEQIMSDFVPTKLWTSTNTFSAFKLNKAINNGAGFLSYSGHGISEGIVTHPPNSERWIRYYSSNLVGLSNGYKLPIMFFDACLTAKLDHSEADKSIYYSKPTSRILKLFLDDYNPKLAYILLDSNVVLSEPKMASNLIPCFAWSCVGKNNGGAIATIGATRTAYGDLNYGCEYLAVQYYKAYSPDETVSQMLTKAQNAYLNNLGRDYFTIEEFILLGDPSLKMGGYETGNGSPSSSPNGQQIDSSQQYSTPTSTTISQSLPASR